MCKVSEKSILLANDRMKKYKIGGVSKDNISDSFTVDTHVLGKTYSHTFTEEKVNAIFGRVLNNMKLRYGKAL